MNPGNVNNLTMPSGVLNCGSIMPAFKYFLMVLRDIPVRRAISRIGSFSRKAIRLIMFKSPMWIAPLPPPQVAWALSARSTKIKGQLLNVDFTRFPVHLDHQILGIAFDIRRDHSNTDVF